MLWEFLPSADVAVFLNLERQKIAFLRSVDGMDCRTAFLNINV